MGTGSRHAARARSMEGWAGAGHAALGCTPAAGSRKTDPMVKSWLFIVCLALAGTLAAALTTGSDACTASLQGESALRPAG